MLGPASPRQPTEVIFMLKTDRESNWRSNNANKNSTDLYSAGPHVVGVFMLLRTEIHDERQR